LITLPFQLRTCLANHKITQIFTRKSKDKEAGIVFLLSDFWSCVNLVKSRGLQFITGMTIYSNFAGKFDSAIEIRIEERIEEIKQELGSWFISDYPKLYQGS